MNRSACIFRAKLHAPAPRPVPLTPTVASGAAESDGHCRTCGHAVCSCLALRPLPANAAGDFYREFTKACDAEIAKAVLPVEAPQPAAVEGVPVGWADASGAGWRQFTRLDKRASVWPYAGRWMAGMPVLNEDNNYSFEALRNGGIDWTAQPKHADARSAMLWADAALATLDAARPFEVGERVGTERGGWRAGADPGDFWYGQQRVYASSVYPGSWRVFGYLDDPAYFATLLEAQLKAEAMAGGAGG